MRRKLTFTIIFLILLVFVWYVGMRLFTTPTAEPDFSPLVELPEPGLDFSIPTPSPLQPEQTTSGKLKQTAWIPDWDIENGYQSLVNNAQYFDSVSPVWYYLDKDGNVQAKRAGLEKLRSFCQASSIKLIPSISSFNADEFTKILSDDTKLQTHIEYLKNEVTTYGYDGLDLDYESLYLDDQPEFLRLVKALYEFLNPQGKVLTIAVMPNWTDADIFRSLRQTRQVQDWGEIGRYVHELRIMTYNLTDYVSTYPGPVAPLDWVQANLRYARTKVDMSKVVLGINLYGYDGWSNNLVVPEPYLSMLANLSAEKGQADAVTYKTVQQRAARKTAQRMEQYSQEQLLQYSQDGKSYLIFYQDYTSAQYRFELARDWGVLGVAHWRMGSEDQSIYSLK